MKDQGIPWQYFLFKLHIVYLHEKSEIILGVRYGTQYHDTSCLRLSFHLQYSRHNRCAREMPYEKLLVHGYVLHAHYMLVRQFENPVDRQKWGAVRQHIHYFMDIHQGRLTNVILGDKISFFQFYNLG